MKKLLTILALSLSITAVRAQEYANRVIEVGKKAPELALSNPQGKPQKLSEMTKGHVVLLDFWASWCRPCRAANPQVVALYNKYKEKKFKGAKKGFTIVSVSLDQNKEAWLAAIAADKLIWPNHLSDLGSWNSQAAKIYGVEYIPQAFLIGPDGKILAKYNFAEQAEADLAKMAQ